MRRCIALAYLCALPLFGCGDVGRAVLDVEFASEDLELRTRALEVVVREVGNTDGCATLWSPGDPTLAQDTAVVPYPNRVDLRASPVDLDQYEALTLIVYAYPTVDVAASQPIAGGCVEGPLDPAATTEIPILLEPAP